MRLFGYEITRAAKAAAARDRGRPAASRGRPSWFRNWGAALGLWSPTLPTEQLLPTYEEMRHLFPILDTAIKRTVRMVGAPAIQGSKRVTDDLSDWINRVQVNQAESSLGTWLSTHLDNLLTFGFAVGEIVPRADRRDVYALTNLDPLTILLAQGDDPLSIRILQRQQGPPFRVELLPDLTLYSVIASRGRDPYGSSTFRSLPFMATTLSTILNATAATWEREGAPSYHVNWQPDPMFSDPDGTLSQQIVDGIANEWQSAMDSRRGHSIRDFFSSGNVTASPISSAAQLIALQDPYRAMMEQMVSVTDLPSWMLGLHWSTTERMSTQQVEMLIAHIEGLRALVTPPLQYLLDLRQRFTGRPGRFTLAWPAISLHDETQQATAELWQEQARQLRLANGRTMWELGFWTQLQAATNADPDLTAVAVAHATPPTPTAADPANKPTLPQAAPPASGANDARDLPPLRPLAPLGHGPSNGRHLL